MRPEEINLGDWMRLLIGEVPVGFLLETALRICIIYLILIVSMRVMGKRMGKVLTRNEMIAMISLAAANGVALQSPDRGLLPVLIIAMVIVAFQWFISWQSMKNKKFESLVLDDLDTLVADGRLQLDRMERTRLSRERVLAQFRSQGIDNLGRVQRTYLEANGAFTILQFPESRAGLSTIPNWDEDFRREQQKAAGHYACGSCGKVVAAPACPEEKCPDCGLKEWEEAVQT